jgi:hypothetical protein
MTCGVVLLLSQPVEHAELDGIPAWLQDMIRFGNSTREYVLLHENSNIAG